MPEKPKGEHQRHQSQKQIPAEMKMRLKRESNPIDHVDHSQRPAAEKAQIGKSNRRGQYRFVVKSSLRCSLKLLDGGQRSSLYIWRFALLSDFLKRGNRRFGRRAD